MRGKIILLSSKRFFRANGIPTIANTFEYGGLVQQNIQKTWGLQLSQLPNTVRNSLNLFDEIALEMHNQQITSSYVLYEDTLYMLDWKNSCEFNAPSNTPSLYPLQIRPLCNIIWTECEWQMSIQIRMSRVTTQIHNRMQQIRTGWSDLSTSTKGSWILTALGIVVSVAALLGKLK